MLLKSIQSFYNTDALHGPLQQTVVCMQIIVNVAILQHYWASGASDTQLAALVEKDLRSKHFWHTLDELLACAVRMNRGKHGS